MLDWPSMVSLLAFVMEHYTQALICCVWGRIFHQALCLQPATFGPFVNSSSGWSFQRGKEVNITFVVFLMTK